MIKSLLDTDLYKFTMQQIVLHKFPESTVKYKFKCRNEDIDFSPYIDEINEEISKLCQLKFTEEELVYLRTLPFIKEDYINRLEDFKLKRKHIKAQIEDNELKIEIEGSWFDTILFEVPVLAIVNEVYFRHQDVPENGKEDILFDKINELGSSARSTPNIFKFADFGTRRRFSAEWHRQVVEVLAEKFPSNFVGTSNVLFAKGFGLKPIGTMAHEYLQACQVYARLVDSQKFALQTWADEYRGQLGIALTDIIGMDAFLRDFDLYFAKLFDGLRHDSGDPIEWGEKAIKHYEDLGVDPKNKHLVFSDGLNFKKAKAIWLHFYKRINTSFGIGTNLTNDCGINPLNIVIKMIECNGQPVAKISDSPGKSMCEDEKYINMIKYAFNK